MGVAILRSMRPARSHFEWLIGHDGLAGTVCSAHHFGLSNALWGKSTAIPSHKLSQNRSTLEVYDLERGQKQISRHGTCSTHVFGQTRFLGVGSGKYFVTQQNFKACLWSSPLPWGGGRRIFCDTDIFQSMSLVKPVSLGWGQAHIL